MYRIVKSLWVVLFLLLSALSVCPQKAFCGKFPGEITEVKGTVEVQKAGRPKWYKAISGLPVQLKDRIRTQANSSCNLELDDGSLIFVDENTEASVEYIEVSSDKHTSTLGLWFGKLLNNIKKTSSTKMKIKCPTAVISVRGTEFAVIASSLSADVGVFEGAVAVSSATTMSGEELEEQVSTSTAAAQVTVSTTTVQISTSSIVTTPLAEVSVKPGEQTTVAHGETPQTPTKLSRLMQKNMERLDSLKGRVQELREKLKRTKPEYLDQVRQEVLDRVMSMKDERNELREKLKYQREHVK